jgi:Fe2+ transport system protein FeoA
VKVLSAAPFGGPLVVLAGGAELAISRDLAALIGIA